MKYDWENCFNRSRIHAPMGKSDWDVPVSRKSVCVWYSNYQALDSLQPVPLFSKCCSANPGKTVLRNNETVRNKVSMKIVQVVID